MKFNLTVAFLLVSSVFSAEKPEEARLRLRRELDASGRDSGAGGDGGDGGDTTTASGGDGNDGGSSGSSACFSAFNDVEVRGKGMISMDELKVGDFVRTNSDDFSRVLTLGHLDNDIETHFFQLYAEGLEKPLEITGAHLVYVSGKAIRADEVNVGDILNDNNSVSEIKSVKRSGIYAPVTQSGDVVVSGVRASSYYAFLDKAHGNYQNGVSHLFFAPHRAACEFDFGMCENEAHTDGFSNWAYKMIQICEMSNKYSGATQNFLAFLSFAVGSVVIGLEQMVNTPIATFSVIGFVAYKKYSQLKA